MKKQLIGSITLCILILLLSNVAFAEQKGTWTKNTDHILPNGVCWNYVLEDGTLYTGWLKDNGKWYYLQEAQSEPYLLTKRGDMVRGSIEINGKYWLFDTDGTLVQKEGWGQTSSTSGYYYVNADGTLKTGWQKIDGKWYYFDRGYTARGQRKIGNKIWFFDRKNCALVEKEGWQLGGSDGPDKWFYVNADGSCSTGWLKVGSHWYYLDPSEGYMYQGVQTINGKNYVFDSNGSWIEHPFGWFKLTRTNEAIGSKPLTFWYYLNQDGTKKTGWVKDGTSWYYFHEYTGIMQTGWQKIHGRWYYLKSSGAMATGWQKINGKWYYLTDSGIMQTGWVKLSGKWYYLNRSGIMVTGTQTIGGKTYTFNSSGVWVD